jgi:peptide deformylase
MPDLCCEAAVVYGGLVSGHIEAMAILKIARMGHPVLGQVAEPIADPTSPAVAHLIADMVDTLRDASGAGLAAPQVHVPVRLVMFHVPASRAAEEDGADDGDEDAEDAEALEDEAHGEGEPLTVLINPEIEPIGDEMVDGLEACLSLPGLAGIVPRHRHIKYRWTDIEGQRHEREARGFHARVVQHECDHLDGILYPMRMTDLSKFTFTSELGRAGEG